MLLLVGGSGFIGVNFSWFLKEKNCAYTIYDIKKSPYLPSDARFIKGDIRDFEALSDAMSGCDSIFHFVTIPPHTRLSEKEQYDISVNGTKNLLSAAHHQGINKIIFTSSASHVYGDIEKQSGPLSETTPLHPINAYGKHKVINEKILKRASKNFGMKIIILRLSMILGPYNFDPILYENVTSVLHNKRVVLVGNGETKNQCLHVNDLNHALFAAISFLDTMIHDFEIFNISGKESYSLNQFINLLKESINSSSKIIHLPYHLAVILAMIAWGLHQSKIHPSYLRLLAQDQIFDCKKATQYLNWESTHSVKSAIDDTIYFYKSII